MAASSCRFLRAPQTRESIQCQPELLEELEVLFSGWGIPMLDTAFLEAAPNLKAIFYGAGTIGHCTTDAFWDRDIVITSAYAANAVPVAEYTLATILLSLKNFWKFEAELRSGRGWGNQCRQIAGTYHSTVALIGCGMIARRLIELLRPFDIRCIVYDPFLSEADAAHLRVTRCTLNEAFIQGDVVSLHAPSKPETRGMITGEHFALMKEGASFINTARGPIVNETQIIEALERRPDLTAILDVFYVEPLPLESPLLRLPNVVLTPHIAGSLGPECQRLGNFMVEEFRRYMDGAPLQWRITRDIAARLA